MTAYTGHATEIPWKHDALGDRQGRHPPFKLRFAKGGGMKRSFSLLLLAAPWVANAGEDAQLREQVGKLFGKIEAVAAARVDTPEAGVGPAPFWGERAPLDRKTPCASCHPANDFGDDRRGVSPPPRR